MLSNFARAALIVGTVALWSCAGSNSMSTPSVSGAETRLGPGLQTLRQAGSTSFVWVSDVHGALYKYAQTGHNQSPLLSITNGLSNPMGLAIDQHGNVFVANSGAQNVLQFDPNGNLLATYSDTNFNPVSVALCSDGTLYAAQPGPSEPSVAIYRNGSKSPTTFLLIAGNPIGLACDKSANVYILSSKSVIGPGGVIEYAAGGFGAPRNLSITVNEPQGIAVTKSGLIVLADKEDGILFFTPGGKQVRDLKGFKEATNVAFTESDGQLFVTDPGLHPQAVDLVTASQGRLLDRITKPGFKSLFGVATYPADHY